LVITLIACRFVDNEFQDVQYLHTFTFRVQ
jgi:hypothetical protein